jgi:phosphoglycerate dehydrogenase-like enzyme
VRIVVAIHDLPVWSIPASEVARVAHALPEDEVRDARGAADRRREFADADVLFATRISADEFALARHVTWIQSSAVGVGGLLPPALVASPVIVTNARGVHTESIAEHAIALILALRRQLSAAMVGQIERRWLQVELSAPRVSPLAETRVLIVGLGSIGARVASHAAGLGMHVTGVRRRTDAPVPPGVAAVLGPDRLLEGLRDADVVVLAVPRTEETRALIGRTEFGVMKRSALLINVARGRLVDEAALVEALERGQIAGAGLDAFQQEPLPADHPLWRAPNALITPHTASFSGDYWGPVVDLFLDNMARFRRGEALLNVVDKARGY